MPEPTKKDTDKQASLMDAPETPAPKPEPSKPAVAEIKPQPKAETPAEPKAIVKAENSSGNVPLDLKNLTLNQVNFIGKTMAASGMFADISEPGQALVKILAGQEIGIGPFQAMSGIHIIKNKATMGANLMAAGIKSKGKYNFRVKKIDNTGCDIEFFEKFNGQWEAVGVSSFTMEDARKAGTQNIDKFPRNMLFARALSNGYKWYAPDAFGGTAVYVPEELGGVIDVTGELADPGNATSFDQALSSIESAQSSEEVDKVVTNLPADIRGAELTQVTDAAFARVQELTHDGKD